MLKDGIKVISKKGLHYIVEDDGRLFKFKPWLGDAFSFLYDFIMKSSIFPKKLGGDINQHYDILSKELKDFHEKRVLEIRRSDPLGTELAEERTRARRIGPLAAESPFDLRDSAWPIHTLYPSLCSERGLFEGGFGRRYLRFGLTVPEWTRRYEDDI